jgi:hypothetical protein
MAATPTTAHRTRSVRTVPPWAAPVAAGVAAVGACTIAGLTDSGDTWMPACPLKTMTGIDCPGCGMTRSLRALTGGDLSLAVDQNVLLVVALPLLVAGWVLWLARSLGRTDRQLITWNRSSATLVTVVLLGFWALRLLPGPMSWLASGTA